MFGGCIGPARKRCRSSCKYGLRHNLRPSSLAVGFEHQSVLRFRGGYHSRSAGFLSLVNRTRLCPHGSEANGSGGVAGNSPTGCWTIGVDDSLAPVSDFSPTDGRRFSPASDNCLTGCKTIGVSDHAAANARMKRRLGRENPFISGNSVRKSAASRATTFAPQPSVC